MEEKMRLCRVIDETLRRFSSVEWRRRRHIDVTRLDHLSTLPSTKGIHHTLLLLLLMSRQTIRQTKAKERKKWEDKVYIEYGWCCTFNIYLGISLNKKKRKEEEEED